MLSPSPPLPFTGSHDEVPELPMSPPLGPFSALSWSPPAYPHSQQSGPAPWEFGPGSPLPADTAARGPSLSPFLPPPTAHLLGQASLAQVHTSAALSSLRASLRSFRGAPHPPAALGVPPQRHHRRPTGVGSRRGSRGGARQEGEQVPQCPCLGRSPVLAGFCTLCALGGRPTSAGPERQAVSAENWPRPQCSQRPASGRGRQTRTVPSHCFSLASLPSALGFSPEPLPPPPHPSWRPTRAPRI